MPYRQEILDCTYRGKQYKVGREYRIGDLSEKETPCIVWIDGVLWSLAPIKYTNCLKLRTEEKQKLFYNPETGQKRFSKHQVIKKELPTDTDVKIYEAIELQGDRKLIPENPKDAYLPISVSFEEITFLEYIDYMPYLNVTNKKHELCFRVIFFSKTETYKVYDIQGTDETIHQKKSPFDPGKTILRAESAGEVINFISGELSKWK